MSLNFGQSLFPTRRRLGLIFDFQDTLTGNGYVQYFGALTIDSQDAEKYILSTRRIDSLDKSTRGTGIYHTTLPVNTETTINFDTLIGQTLTIKGLAVIEFLANTQNNESLAFVIKIQRIRGAVTTDIVTLADFSQNIGITGTDKNERRYTFSEETIETKLIKGDTLRLNMVLTTTADTGGSYRLYHDPNNRDGITKQFGQPTANGDAREYQQQSSLILNVPFKVIT